MTARVQRRADELAAGDRLDLAGDVWTVAKAKRRGKRVLLKVESRRGSFAEEVRAKARYTVVVEAPPRGGRPTRERAGPSARGSDGAGPLLDGSGAMRRWAQPKDLQPPAEPARSGPWEKAATPDEPVVAELGARLVGVEVQDGKLIVPPVSDSTIFGHLLTLHGVRYDGATFAEAKAWAREHDPGGTTTAEEALDVVSFEKAFALHEALHEDVAAAPAPHWHRKKAPK